MACLTPWCFLLVVAAAGLVEAKNDTDREVLEKCNEKFKLPESVIDKILTSFELDDSKDGKCLLKCSLEAVGMMKEDGTIDEEGSKKYVAERFPNPKHQEKILQQWSDCQKKVKKEGCLCEYSYSLLVCLADGPHKTHIFHPEKK